jgi:hypothetical protein
MGPDRYALIYEGKSKIGQDSQKSLFQLSSQSKAFLNMGNRSGGIREKLKSSPDG